MKIAVIVAMEKEMKNYLKLFSLQKIDEKFCIYETKYQNKQLYFALGGIGKVNASILTEYLIEHYQVELILNSGCCGSLSEECKVLDTVLVDFVTYHDFFPERILKEAIVDQGKIETDKVLRKKLEHILKAKKISYLVGGIASGDCFVTSSKMRDEIKERTKAIAVDMESMSIAQTARLNQIPFLIIRSISDFADGVEEQEEQAANISSMLVKEFIHQL